MKPIELSPPFCSILNSRISFPAAFLLFTSFHCQDMCEVRFLVKKKVERRHLFVDLLTRAISP